MWMTSECFFWKMQNAYCIINKNCFSVATCPERCVFFIFDVVCNECSRVFLFWVVVCMIWKHCLILSTDKIVLRQCVWFCMKVLWICWKLGLVFTDDGRFQEVHLWTTIITVWMTAITQDSNPKWHKWN